MVKNIVGLHLAKNKTSFMKWQSSYKMDVLKTSIDYLLVFQLANIVKLEVQPKSTATRFLESLAIAKVQYH